MNGKGLKLDDLSSEILIKILHCCPYPTILRFASTCKIYHNLVAQSISLQLHIELGTNGLELVQGSFKRGATYSAILDNLRQYRDAWLDMNTSLPFVRPVGDERMLLWELREGFYIKGFSQTEGRQADALRFIPLDSEAPDLPPLFFDFTFDEFTTDPWQGLIAILSRGREQPGLSGTSWLSPHDYRRGIKFDIHLCSTTTGLAHSLAQHPKLTIEFDFNFQPSWANPEPALTIEIMEGLLMIQISNSLSYDVIILDWKSGVFLNRIHSNKGICAVNFLDRQYLVVLSATCSNSAHLNTLALLVYAIYEGFSIEKIHPHNPLHVSALPISQPILRFDFPRIKESSRISQRRFLLRSDPTPGRIVYTNSAAFSCPYVMTLGATFSFREINNSGEEPPSYRVFIDGGLLLDQIHIHSLEESRVLPWSSWGPSMTRWFVARTPPDYWIGWISSSRYVVRLPHHPRYCVFDLSPQNAGRFRNRFAELYQNSCDPSTQANFAHSEWLEEDLSRLASISSPDDEFTVVTVGKDVPHIIHNDDRNAFDEPIISRLPYRIMFDQSDKPDSEAWQITGNCIVGVDTLRPASEAIVICKLETDLIYPNI